MQGFAAAVSLIAIALLKAPVNSPSANAEVNIDVDLRRGIPALLPFAFLTDIWSVIHNAMLVKFKKSPINPCW